MKDFRLNTFLGYIIFIYFLMNKWYFVATSLCNILLPSFKVSPLLKNLSLTAVVISTLMPWKLIVLWDDASKQYVCRSKAYLMLHFLTSLLDETRKTQNEIVSNLRCFILECFEVFSSIVFSKTEVKMNLWPRNEKAYNWKYPLGGGKIWKIDQISWWPPRARTRLKLCQD